MPDPNSTQQRIAAQANAFKVAAIQMASGPNVNGNLSEARRLMSQGGIKLNDDVLSWDQAPIAIKAGDILRRGKRQAVKLKPQA